MRKFPRKLHIDVTQRDIKLGKKQDACECPIARAARRALGIRQKGLVGVCTTIDIGMDSHGNSVRYDIPQKADWFISAFDWGSDSMGMVKPFSFVAVRFQ